MSLKNYNEANTQKLFSYISNLDSKEEINMALSKAEKRLPGISDFYKLSTISSDSLQVAMHDSTLNQFAFNSGLKNQKIDISNIENPTARELIQVVESMSGVPIYTSKNLNSYLNSAYSSYKSLNPSKQDLNSFNEIMRQISPKRIGKLPKKPMSSYAAPYIAKDREEKKKHNKKGNEAYNELLLLSKQLGERK